MTYGVITPTTILTWFHQNVRLFSIHKNLDAICFLTADVAVKTLSPTEHYAVIFATDGLWNVVTANDAAQTVAKYCNGKDLQANVDVAAELVSDAIRICKQRQIKSDNVSVVCALIGPSSAVSAPCLRSDCLLVKTVPFTGRLESNVSEEGAPSAKRPKNLMQIDGVVRNKNSELEKRRKPSPPASPVYEKNTASLQAPRTILSAVKREVKLEDSESSNSPSSSSESVAQNGPSFLPVEPVVGGR